MALADLQTVAQTVARTVARNETGIATALDPLNIMNPGKIMPLGTFASLSST